MKPLGLTDLEATALDLIICNGWGDGDMRDVLLASGKRFADAGERALEKWTKAYGDVAVRRQKRAMVKRGGDSCSV